MKVERAFVRIALWAGFACLASWLAVKGNSMTNTELLLSGRMFGAVMMFVAFAIAVMIAATMSTSLRQVRQAIEEWWNTPIGD